MKWSWKLTQVAGIVTLVNVDEFMMIQAAMHGRGENRRNGASVPGKTTT